MINRLKRCISVISILFLTHSSMTWILNLKFLLTHVLVTLERIKSRFKRKVYDHDCSYTILKIESIRSFCGQYTIIFMERIRSWDWKYKICSSIWSRDLETIRSFSWKYRIIKLSIRSKILIRKAETIRKRSNIFRKWSYTFNRNRIFSVMIVDFTWSQSLPANQNPW